MSAHREPARPWVHVGELIAADTDPPCRVITSISALVGWYSACETARLVPQSLANLDDAARLPTYVVLTNTDRRELPDEVAAFQELVDSGMLIAVDGPGTEFADVFRVAP